jgi:RNA polymerase sigma-70 factor, ECF subfamily
MTLDELLLALNDGEPRAEERLSGRLRLELLPYFKKRVPPSDAEDLTQETLVRVVERLRTKPFEPGPVSFRSFAFGIAGFRVRDDRRAKVRHDLNLPPFPDWCDVPESSPDETLIILQQSTLLHAALAAIKTRYRRALESWLRDEDPRDFAAAEGIEVGTVRSRIHRALELVRADIEARRRTPRGVSPTG